MKKTFKTIYRILVIFLIIMVIVLPKENSLEDMQRNDVDIIMSEDGSSSIKEHIVYEKRFELTRTIIKTFEPNMDVRDVKVYGNNILGSHEIKHDFDGTVLTFPKSSIYASYDIKYSSGNLVSKTKDNQYVLAFNPVQADILRRDEINITLETPIDIKLGEIHTLGIDEGNIIKRKNGFEINETNFPSESNIGIIMKFDEGLIAERFKENIPEFDEKRLDNIEERSQEKLENIKNLKKQNNFEATIYRKYLMISLYIIIILQLLKYILDIIRSLKENNYGYSNSEIKEEKRSPVGSNMVQAFVIENNIIYKDKLETKNLIKSIIIKLHEYGYITLEDDRIIIADKSQKEICKLNYSDKYILEKIYVADDDNDSIITYSDLQNAFRFSSQELLSKLYEDYEMQKQKLVKEGVYTIQNHRVDFSMILMLIPLFIAYSLVGYMHPILSIIMFVIMYIAAKVSILLSSENYSKKGINVKYNMDGYKKYLKSLNDYVVSQRSENYHEEEKKQIIKEMKKRNIFDFLNFGKKKSLPENEDIQKENQIYRAFFGYETYENRNEKLDTLSEAICSYIDILSAMA